MNKKYIAYVVAPVLGLALLAAATASAHGFFGFGGSNLTPDEIAQKRQTQFQGAANLLGLSVDDVKAAWAKGESLQQLAQDHGISQDQLKQKMLDAGNQQTQQRLQVLVDKGVITQAQADSRLQFMQQLAQNGKGGHLGRGFRGGWGF